MPRTRQFENPSQCEHFRSVWENKLSGTAATPTSRPMRNLRSTIADVRAERRGRTIRCPAHDDRRASLSVGLGSEGGIVLCCHAGCQAEAVLDAAGLSWQDIMPERRPDNQPRVRSWEIREIDGTLRAIHRRYD